ncbi:hypothetical protein Tco_0632230, partial [Tanacetum coccineum]
MEPPIKFFNLATLDCAKKQRLEEILEEYFGDEYEVFDFNDDELEMMEDYL